MKEVSQPTIKLKQYLKEEDYHQINELEKQCMQEDKITLKLELDYKLAYALSRDSDEQLKQINEFLYFMGEQLVGYIGICSFGGQGAPLEITGMVHPNYRRQGIFTLLYGLVLDECKRRKAQELLLLCDRSSGSGQAFLKKIHADHQFSEFEMFLQKDRWEIREEQLCGVTIRQAGNADAYEIARQNAVYFDEELPDQMPEEGDDPKDLLLPEEEAKRGVVIYLAQKDETIIGKVHLQIDSYAVGGIYGLGVMPEYRGKGYGRAVLLHGIMQLKAAGAKEIMLQVEAKNATALRLYQSCGFKETSVMDYYCVIPQMD